MLSKTQKQKRANKKYRHKIEIVKYIADNSGLSQKKVPSHYLYARANVINSHGRELTEARNNNTEILTTFEMRYIPKMKITNEMGILYRGETYDIKNVENVRELDRELVIKAELI